MKNTDSATSGVLGCIASIGLLLLASSLSVSADTVIIYSNSNSLFGINITNQQEYPLTTAASSSSVNALAANSDQGLIYYGSDTSIYYWDPALGSDANAHFLIHDFSFGNNQAPITNIDSAGGSYLDGKYYVGSESNDGFVDDVYAVTMSGDGRSLVAVEALNINAACQCSDEQLGGFGDLAVINDGAGPVMYGSTSDISNNNSGSSAGIWRFDLNSNTFALLSAPTGGQLGRGLDQNIYTNIGTSIRELDTNSGNTSPQSLMTTNQAIWDLTGGFSFDFGDAPESYGSALHLVDDGLKTVYLGSIAPDDEPYSLNASTNSQDGLGDDANGIDDEDAFSNSTSVNELRAGVSDYSLPVSCAGGTVAAWIDFNLNGSFDDNERNSNHPVSCQGQNAELVWSGITIYSAADSFIRIRTASLAGDVNQAVGFAKNGEVEDHEISFLKPLLNVQSCPAGSSSYIYESSDTPKRYNNLNLSSTQSYITVPDALFITDVNVLEVKGTNNTGGPITYNLYVNDDPTQLSASACVDNTSFNIGFDDDAERDVNNCPLIEGQSYTPLGNLSKYNGENAQGTWRLSVANSTWFSTGSIDSWAVQVCASDTVTAGPDIRVGKTVEVDGRTVEVSLLVRNTGMEPLYNMQVIDNLDAVFGAGNYQVSSPPEIISSPGSFTVNPDFNGQQYNDQPVYNGGSLQPGQELELRFSVDVGFDVWEVGEEYKNQAEVYATDPVGTAVSDLSAPSFDLSVDEDEPTPIIMGSGLEVSGTVFEDSSSSSQRSHDGVQQTNEVGVANRVVSIIDVASGAELSTTVTDADGYWVAQINPLYDGQPIEVVVAPNSNTHFISESPAPSDAILTDGRVIFKAQASPSGSPSLNEVNVGLINRSSFVSDRSSNVTAASSVEYLHIFYAATHGEIDFKAESSYTSSSSTWSELVKVDNNCDGLINGSDGPLSGPISIKRDEKICLMATVDVPADAQPGDTHILNMLANLYPSDSAGTGHGLVSDSNNTDTSNVIGQAAGDLRLEKTVSNITLGGQAVEANSALPGHVLEYVISYRNLGSGPIVDLVIDDEAPAFTVIEPNSSQCLQSPPTLSCSANASSGIVQWSFEGGLAVGAEGQVSYRVLVE